MHLRPDGYRSLPQATLGVSTRRKLVESLRISRLSKSQVSDMVRALAGGGRCRAASLRHPKGLPRRAGRRMLGGARAGELDAFDVDQNFFQYSRAAKDLWKFHNSLQVEVAAALIRDQPPRDWRERGAPRSRFYDAQFRGS